MEIKKGIAVSPGVVISTAVVLDAEDLVVPERHVEPSQVGAEVARFRKAVDASVAETETLRKKVEAEAGKEIAGIFDAHIGILRDKTFASQVENEINKNRVTAEYGVSVAMRRLFTIFSRTSD